MERVFRGDDISENGTEAVNLLTKKPSLFVGGNAYATVKQRILNGPKAFYERFAGLRK